MKKTSLFFATFLLFAHVLSAQTDEVGPGRAIYFDGIDDYVDFGNIYDQLSLPLTISAWVYQEVNSTTQNPIFASQDGLDLYNGFWLCVNATHAFVGYGDGNGYNNPTFRREKSAALPNSRNRWFHVATVVRGATDMDIYINGQNAGGAYSGFSNLPMDSNYPADVAKAGAFLSNGQNHAFKGFIDELRVFNRALTEEEIREGMSKSLTGDVPGLVGYWTFDEVEGDVVYDHSPNQFHGTLKGNPARPFSAAPVGDESVYVYPADWTGEHLTLGDLTISNVTGGPWGAHVYKVNDPPSQDTGLEAQPAKAPYYGVFIADNFLGKTFDMEVCEYFGRENNAVPVWAHATQHESVPDRIELVPGASDEAAFSLGANQALCEQESLQLQPDLADFSGLTFSWNTGASTPAITVNEPGTYMLTVQNECGFEKQDSIKVTLVEGPAQFTFGSDQVLCPMIPRMLQPYPADDPTFNYTWHDGSNDPTMLASDYGTYFVTVENECGTAADTVTFTKSYGELFFDLGPDTVVCLSEPLLLTPLKNPTGFDFDWYNQSNESSLAAVEYGKVWVSIESECAFGSDTIRLYESKIVLDSLPNVITPNTTDELNRYFYVDPKITTRPSIEIFNRWGKLVFRSLHYQNDWDAEGLHDGVYFYQVWGPCIEPKKGIIHVLR